MSKKDRIKKQKKLKTEVSKVRERTHSEDEEEERVMTEKEIPETFVGDDVEKPKLKKRKKEEGNSGEKKSKKKKNNDENEDDQPSDNER